MLESRRQWLWKISIHSKTAAFRLDASAQPRPVDESVLRDPKKLSMGALSLQFPLRLIKASTP
jgi:hypothetical protein